MGKTLGDKLFVIEKQQIVYGLLCFGMLIAIWGSLNPWFMWSLFKVYMVLAAMPLVLAMLYSRNLKDDIFTRNDFQIPLLSYILLCVVLNMVNGKNVFAYVLLFVNGTIMLTLFRLRLDALRRLGDFLCKSLSVLLIFSIAGYVLFLLGRGLPHYHIANEELGYSYENYRLFLLDDRAVLRVIPRFCSVFLEPGHLGTYCTFLLLSQIGKWKRWYNVVLFVAIFMTFSLSAYVLLVIALFGAAWIRRKAIIGKIVALLAALAMVTTTAIFYNGGDNLVNLLIVQRLTVNEDGKLEGDNRNTSLFRDEFDSFLESDDIFTGREYNVEKFGWGNAGFRLFIYDNGFITLFFVVAFYALFPLGSKDRRGRILMWFIAFASFIPRSTPITFYYFVPLYILSFVGTPLKKQT